MDKKKEVTDFIRLIENKYKDMDKHVYRGTNNVYSDKKDGIRTNLHQWAKKYVGLNNKSLPNYFEEHIVKSARRHFPSFTSNVEILTEIQHYRGKTNLLDFSRNLY